ncbi:hypothetical protein SAMN05216588_102299 [Pseudomonas flavescens]|uniref:Uncharacterized protein n=1 Tax=Phytopseudomonas flavescens TaxID=29435 RepID=A0A1G7ZD14_9GAMM|nr:hypothetical protein SAMN05216588_102299 [Pseudomonas flavescens]
MHLLTVSRVAGLQNHDQAPGGDILARLEHRQPCQSEAGQGQSAYALAVAGLGVADGHDDLFLVAPAQRPAAGGACMVQAEQAVVFQILGCGGGSHAALGLVEVVDLHALLPGLGTFAAGPTAPQEP